MFNNVDNNFAYVTSQANFQVNSQEQMEEAASATQADGFPPSVGTCSVVCE